MSDAFFARVKAVMYERDRLRKRVEAADARFKDVRHIADVLLMVAAARPDARWLIPTASRLRELADGHLDESVRQGGKDA
jgi:hypothetical protein